MPLDEAQARFDLDAVAGCVRDARPDLEAAVRCHAPMLSRCIGDAEGEADFTACQRRSARAWRALAKAQDVDPRVAARFDPAKCDMPPPEGQPPEQFRAMCLTTAWASRAVVGHIGEVWGGLPD